MLDPLIHLVECLVLWPPTSMHQHSSVITSPADNNKQIVEKTGSGSQDWETSKSVVEIFYKRIIKLFIIVVTGSLLWYISETRCCSRARVRQSHLIIRDHTWSRSQSRSIIQQQRCISRYWLQCNLNEANFTVLLIISEPSSSLSIQFLSMSFS